MIKVLFVDDQWEEGLYPLVYGQHLASNGINVEFEARGFETLSRLSADQDIKLVLLDLRFPGQDITGEEILDNIRAEFQDEIPVIILTQVDEIATAVRCMKRGANFYFLKHTIDHPLDFNQLAGQIHNAVQSAALLRSNRELQFAAGTRQLIGESPALAEVKRQIARAAQTDVTVLITGESGTGKELVAKAIHQLSPRQKGRYVPVSCGAIPAELAESELFGHERGAFTGAVQQRKGRFELANHGTIFLDELGELPLSMQPILLRVLQEREIERVGGTQPIPVDTRVIAATNQDLPQQVKAGNFREDLFYRLNVFEIQLPPLRDRREDIPLLAAAFIDRFNIDHQRTVLGIDPKAEPLLMSHDWRGNVRELENCISGAIVACPPDTEYLLPAHFPPALRSMPAKPSPLPLPPPTAKASIPFPQPIEAIERQAIALALRETLGNRTQAAKLLKMDTNTFRRKLKQYTFRFSIDTAYQNELHDGQPISENLVKAFNTHNVRLSQDTAIVFEARAHRWLIIENNKPIYTITQDKNGLNVCTYHLHPTN